MLFAYEKDVKKNIKKKIGEIHLLYFSYELTVVYSLFFTYALLDPVIEKCLLNSYLFKLIKILEKYL